MTTNLVVAITLGQRDLQVLASCPNGLERLSLNKNSVGAFHRDFLSDKSRWRLWVPSAADRPKENKTNEVGFGDGQLKLPQGFVLGAPPGGDTGVWVVPGVIAGAIDEIILAEGARPKRVLLFYTERDRDQDLFAKGEPVAAASILAEWLNTQNVNALPICYLQGKENLQVQDEYGNKALLPAAAKRIDDALRTAATECGKDRIRLYLAAGIPEPSAVAHASAVLHFQVVEPRYQDEGGMATPQIKKVRYSAIEVLNARRETRELIGRGEFQAADVLAARFQENGPAGDWQRAVHAVARYFGGYMTEALNLAANVTSTDTGPRLKTLAERCAPRALHVAMRAEAALRADDVLTAAGLVVTFLDVAILDAVEAALTKKKHTTCVDWPKRAILPESFLPTPEQARSAAMQLPPYLRGKNLQIGFSDWFEDHPEIWVRAVWQKRTIINLLDSPGGRGDLRRALERMCEFLYDRKPGRESPADFRNRIIHCLPSEGEIKNTADLFVKAALWLGREGARRFLSTGTCGTAVLGALGCPEAQRTYNDLVAALTADIDAAPLYAGG